MQQLTDSLFVGLLEAAPDAMVCADRDGRIVLVNAQAEKLFGYQREDLAGQPVEILVPDAMKAGHPALRAGYAADPQPRPMGAGKELSGRRRDGSTFPAEISLSAIDTDEGLLVSAAVRDVTERREAAMIAARLASIIESSHDAVISDGLDGLVTSWNPGAERLYGYSASEMVGRNIDVLIPAGRRAAEQEIQDAIARGEQMEQYQTERVRKDGTAVAVSIAMSPIADSTGTIVGVSRVTRDVTAQQRANARFRGLLEAAPDAMVCADRDGRIVLVNAQAEKLFGYQREDLAGQPVEILVPDAMKAGHPALRAGYAADPQPRPMGAGKELSGRRRDGSTFPAEISLSAIDTDEGLLVSAAVRDVTERLALQAEHDRLRTQAERDRLESLGQLAGGVAHDFNNLLGIISGYAAFIGEEVTKDPPQADWQAVRDDIQQIEQAAQRAAGLTRQLLAFGRREVIQPLVLNLNDVIGSLVKVLIATLGERVELATDLAAGLCPVLADPGQIEQVLVNLASNARDAMPAGGTLTIRTASTAIDAAHQASRAGLAPGRYVSLKISDTGTGMAREVADRAFEPFFTTKARADGSGLGLATVYGIIAQAGGQVQIDSEPGTGTTVAMLLPAAAGAVQTAAAPPKQQAFAGGGLTVLIVDDEEALREVARRILTRNGYQVITAASGSEAIKAVASHPAGIDLLLTDVVMPQMPGKEVADRIRVLQPSAKVLFMSGYTEGVLATEGILETGVNLIEKPFTEASLLAKLRDILSAAH